MMTAMTFGFVHLTLIIFTPVLVYLLLMLLFIFEIDLVMNLFLEIIYS